MAKQTVSTKSTLIGFAALAILGAIAFSSHRAAARDRVFTGDIMDSECAEMGSHDMKLNGSYTTAKDCTLSCVKLGASFVLFSSGPRMVFRLDNQEIPRQFAGEKVNVTGTLDRASNMIHVIDIEAAPAPPPRS